MTKFRPLPSQELLRAALHYDSESGLFLRNGRQAGCYRRRREGAPWMVVLHVCGAQFPAHRLAWRWMTGDDPAPLTVDHVDRNPFNNAWSNLRLADVCLQAQNREFVATQGHKGVTFHRLSGKWQARRQVNGVRKHYGLFDSKDEAVAALIRE